MEHSSVLKLATASRLVVVMAAVGYSYYKRQTQAHARWEDAVARELPRDVENDFLR
jgi:hypothetical protein